MKRLENKIAIVTGSTSGIGIGIANLYAREGATVVICGRREERGQEIVDEIIKNGGEAFFHYMDLDDLESIESLFRNVNEKCGRIDILVNNAANVSLQDGAVTELTPEMWDAMFTSDLRGTFFAIKTVIPYMHSSIKAF